MNANVRINNADCDKKSIKKMRVNKRKIKLVEGGGVCITKAVYFRGKERERESLGRRVDSLPVENWWHEG